MLMKSRRKKRLLSQVMEGQNHALKNIVNSRYSYASTLCWRVFVRCRILSRFSSRMNLSQIMLFSKLKPLAGTFCGTVNYVEQCINAGWF